ncbi:MAG: hypothetical protein OEV78_05120 [Spirochaetia bacterium]|nr:hypothetical protein [Spirochaetia bacterium]
MKKFFKRYVYWLLGFLAILPGIFPILPQAANEVITIKLYNSTASRNIALYITNENTDEKLYAMPYSGGAEINGTDAGGNFIRIVEGANQAYTYTVTLLINVDNEGSVNQADLGKTVTGVKGGSDVVIDNLNSPIPLETINLASQQNSVLANQQAGCMLSEQSFNYATSIIAGKSYGFSAISVIFFNSTGNFAANPMMAPAGNHGNVLCVVDMNHNNVIDSGDHYSFGSRVGSSNTNYALGAWSIVP